MALRFFFSARFCFAPPLSPPPAAAAGWAGGGASSWSSRVCEGGGRRVGVLRACCPLVRLVRRLTDLASTAREGPAARGAAGRDKVGPRPRDRCSPARCGSARPAGMHAQVSGTGKHSPACPRSSRTSCHRPSPAPPPRSPPSLRNRLSVLVAVQRHVLSSRPRLHSSISGPRARRDLDRRASPQNLQTQLHNCLLAKPITVTELPPTSQDRQRADFHSVRVSHPKPPLLASLN